MNEVAKLNKTKLELSLEYNHLDMERESRDPTPLSWTGYIGSVCVPWQNFSSLLLAFFCYEDPNKRAKNEPMAKKCAKIFCSQKDPKLS
jgi:hypothetical protein